MYNQSVPTFKKYLGNLSTILSKTAAHCEANKIDPTALLGDRLYPDMFPLTRQVLIACDFAKNSCGRIAAVEIPKFEDNEQTLPELQARIAKTVAFLDSLTEAQFAGAESRSVTFPIRNELKTFANITYLFDFALPNFYFHMSTAYAILRHRGVAVGKGDFLGAY
jgi:uncharacterized protein